MSIDCDFFYDLTPPSSPSFPMFHQTDRDDEECFEYLHCRFNIHKKNHKNHSIINNNDNNNPDDILIKPTKYSKNNKYRRSIASVPFFNDKFDDSNFCDDLITNPCSNTNGIDNFPDEKKIEKPAEKLESNLSLSSKFSKFSRSSDRFRFTITKRANGSSPLVQPPNEIGSSETKFRIRRVTKHLSTSSDQSDENEVNKSARGRTFSVHVKVAENDGNQSNEILRENQTEVYCTCNLADKPVSEYTCYCVINNDPNGETQNELIIEKVTTQITDVLMNDAKSPETEILDNGSQEACENNDDDLINLF
ncbi:hypothetical protein TRFO_24692 [Tritrichomonas foetus]|uniref:Uncharacterized protein n=1 Tax=Tritrichomonas foetus TaxID=1144522 RepID=A0A1J4K842_9EUKA|nr:hypothetical protein TRFO_24692 [Tritrichomonas foetus]|eukprot:OHT07048.1 hypothetical protein TRFO_24692 [Tritrichomonas foetus]